MRLFGSQFDGSFTGEVRSTECCVRIEYAVEGAGRSEGAIHARHTLEVLQHDVASCDCRCHEVYKRWA
jgi:hypothetical protein